MGHNNTKGNRKFIKGRYTATRPKANDWYLLNSSSLLQAMKISAYWFAHRKFLK